MDPLFLLDQAYIRTYFIPRQPYRVLGDIPSLSRIVVPVLVVVQSGFVVILLSRQADKLLQIMWIIFPQHVAPFVIFRAPADGAVLAYQRQRQAPVVAVVKMNFSRRCVFRLHLSGQLLHRQPALRKPRPAFTAHAVCPDFFLQPVQQPHQFSREHHAVAVLTPFLLERLCQAAPLRFFPLAVLCLDPDERREASRLVYRLDTCGVSLHRRQPVSVPAIPRHLRFTRQRHPPRQVTLPPPDPFCHSPSQRVVEVAALDQWLAMLYPRVEHQAVLAVVVVVVGPLVVRPYHTRRDAVRLLRQPAVFIVAVDIVRIFRDAVIKNVIWQAERGLGQETPVESLLTQYHDARAQKQNTDALEKQINERLEGVLSRWLLLKNNVMPEAATGTTAEK